MVTNMVSNSVSHGALLRPKIGQINVSAGLPGVQPVLWNVSGRNTYLTLITELTIFLRNKKRSVNMEIYFILKTEKRNQKG